MYKAEDGKVLWATVSLDAHIFTVHYARHGSVSNSYSTGYSAEQVFTNMPEDTPVVRIDLAPPDWKFEFPPIVNTDYSSAKVWPGEVEGTTKDLLDWYRSKKVPVMLWAHCADLR